MENEPLTLGEARTFYYNANIGIPIAIGLLGVLEICEIVLGLTILKDSPSKWLSFFILVPFLIGFLFWPFLFRITIDKSQNTISFRWMSAFPFVWNCKDSTLQLREIDFFKLELSRVLGKRYYKIFAKLKNTPNDILVISGQDQSCSFEFSGKMQQFTDQLNQIIKM